MPTPTPPPTPSPPVTTCTTVLGASFTGGTTDGPRKNDFTQGETSLNLFWKTDSGILSVPTQEQVDCHVPKAILLYLADITWPYAWEAPSMPLQVFRIGSLVTINTPIEMTQCAGDGCERRSQKSSKTLARNVQGDDRWSCQHLLALLRNVRRLPRSAVQRGATYSCITSPNYTENYAPEGSCVIKLAFS